MGSGKAFDEASISSWISRATNPHPSRISSSPESSHPNQLVHRSISAFAWNLPLSYSALNSPKSRSLAVLSCLKILTGRRDDFLWTFENHHHNRPSIIKATLRSTAPTEWTLHSKSPNRKIQYSYIQWHIQNFFRGEDELSSFIFINVINQSFSNFIYLSPFFRGFLLLKILLGEENVIEKLC